MTPAARREASGVVEGELAAEDVVGVLAEPGGAGLGTLGHAREVHGVAGDEDGCSTLMGAFARHADEAGIESVRAGSTSPGLSANGAGTSGVYAGLLAEGPCQRWLLDCGDGGGRG